jgi:hypothetical protein
MTDTKLYGPFVHGLNKGGLTSIVRNSSLLGTAASNNLANDRVAVRAHVGTFEEQRRKKRWSGSQHTFIEFRTFIPPRPGLPPGFAEWSEEQLVGGYLRIQISRILTGDGQLVPQNQYAAR